MEEWFIRYSCGGFEWGADCSPALRQVLGENGVHDTPTCVFWGLSGAYLVLLHSRAVEYDYLPGDMTMRVEQAMAGNDGVAWAAMGPSGEWVTPCS